MRTSCPELAATTTLDARDIAVEDCVALLLSSFRELRVGQTVELVYGLEPTPLFSRLRTEMPGSFTWLAVLIGPPVWRVRIARLATWWADGQCCGTCGGRASTTSTDNADPRSCSSRR